jgi:hypothetical protein
MTDLIASGPNYLLQWELLEITTQIFAIMQILIEKHWKVRKCKLLPFLASFHYLDQISNPRPLDRWKFKIVLNGSPKIMDFVKNVLSKLALPILINDLFISFAFVCMGEIHTRLMKLCEFIVSLIRLPIHFIVETVCLSHLMTEASSRESNKPFQCPSIGFPRWCFRHKMRQTHGKIHYLRGTVWDDFEFSSIERSWVRNLVQVMKTSQKC